MKIPRSLSGRTFAQTLIRELGYRIVHERGSHLVLETDTPTHQRIAIPDHASLRLGTLNAMIKAVANHNHLSKDDVISLL